MPNFSKPLAPRMSRAPSDSLHQKPRGFKQNPPPPARRQHQNHHDDDFRIDHHSMAMIESGNVVIPTMRGRPSLFGRPRNTIGGLNNRPLQLGRFRNSIAPQKEPRQSLFPLGINIFTASEAQKSEIEGWMKERIEAATPAKAHPKSTLLQHNELSKSTGQRVVRFKEEATPEDKENSEDSSENVVTTTTTMSSMKTMSSYSSSSPMSILKVVDRKKVGFAATPIPTRRRINFDDDDVDDDASLTSSKNVQENLEKKKKEKKDDSVKQKIEDLQELIADITKDDAGSPKPTSAEMESLEKIAESLSDWLKTKNPEMKKKTKKTQLVPICEDDDEEKEEEEEEEEDVAVKKFGKLKVGEISPQKLLHQPLSPINPASSSRSSTPNLDQAFMD